MFRNYIKIAYRNIIKNSIFSFINIFGLAIGVASTVLISYYVQHERSYEDIHENAENIFRLSLDLYNGNEFIINDVETYQTLGPLFTETMPEVKDYVRFFHWGSVAIKAGVEAFYEDKVYFGDPSVFKVFSYEVIEGDPYLAFDQPYKAAISERIAIKLFGKTDVIGEGFQFGTYEEPIEIVGVLANTPQNTHLKFEILMSHATIPKYLSWYLKYTWGSNNEYTYLLMDDGVSVESFNEKLKKFSIENDNIDEEIIISERIGDIHLYSNKSFEPEVNGSAQIVNFMLAIAIFIIVIAWVNYINLSTSRAINRAMEVGVRKSVGASRTQLIRQFLTESFFINLLASAIAFTLVQIAMPSFKQLTDQDLPDGLITQPFIWILLGGIMMIGTFLSGLYPAFVLSGFKPSTVLKGKFGNTGSGFLLRKGLVIFQFLTTVVLITVSLAVYFQLEYLQKLDLGVDIDNTIVVRSPSINVSDSIYYISAKAFSNDLRSNTLVSDVAFAGALPGADIHEIGTTSNVKRESDANEPGSYNYYIIDFDENFIEALDIQLLAGRNFKPEEEGLIILINQKAVETLGFESAEDAVGKNVVYGSGTKFEIIGVVDNFHQRSPKENHIPMLLRYRPFGDQIAVKLNTDETDLALAEIQDVWNTFFPDAAFDYYFLDDRYNYQYKTDQVFSSVVVIFTLLSLSIGLLGLFGLSAYTILQRKKEIGVRKVLGASLSGLVLLLSKDFLKLVLISALLSIPLAYFLISTWLENYTTRIEMSWWLFVIPLIVIMLVAFLSVLGQTLKSTLANPVDSLRYE